MPELDDELDNDGGEDESLETDGAPEKDPSGSEKDPKSTEKRISDLQSKADKETARANKAEARLAAIEAASKEPSTDGGPAPKGGDTESDVILDMARMFAFQQNPKLAQYGIAVTEIDGDTPSEIARFAAELVTRFEKIETQVRNKVLADNGLAPEIDSGAPPAPSRDFSKMSSEDFNKVLNSALNK
jgi:hypothetical protein